jgi:hypothetical protein
MEQQAVTVKLSPEEWRMIATLRDVPEGDLKRTLQEVLRLAIELVREPSCSEVQADGVPCGTAAADCETCIRVTGALESARERLRSV